MPRGFIEVKNFYFECTTSRRLRTCDSLETHVLKLATFRSTHELVDSRIKGKINAWSVRVESQNTPKQLPKHKARHGCLSAVKGRWKYKSLVDFRFWWCLEDGCNLWNEGIPWGNEITPVNLSSIEDQAKRGTVSNNHELTIRPW